MDFRGPTTEVELLNIHDATLDLMRSEGGVYRFPIRQLTIGNVREGQAISYRLDMESPQPAGHIQAAGSFGPVLPEDLGATALSGHFSVAPVDLASIRGLRGTMSANGSFEGRLMEIHAEAKTETPDFAVRRGRSTRVTATAHSVINGLNGDVHFDSIDAHTGATTVHAMGDIAGRPKATNLEIEVRRGRAEDLLGPFLHGRAPISGDVRLHSHAYVAPSTPGLKFLERLQMTGTFEIPSERFTDAKVEQKVSQFSRRAQGQKTSEHDVVAEVSSRVGAKVTVQDGVASTQGLTVAMPGAWVKLRGTFSLRNGDARLLGDLHMDSDISHVTTGWKSWLLKPFAPLFHRGQKGTVVPVAITGSPHRYKVGADLFHDK